MVWRLKIAEAEHHLVQGVIIQLSHDSHRLWWAFWQIWGSDGREMNWWFEDEKVNIWYIYISIYMICCTRYMSRTIILRNVTWASGFQATKRHHSFQNIWKRPHVKTLAILEKLFSSTLLSSPFFGNNCQPKMAAPSPWFPWNCCQLHPPLLQAFFVGRSTAGSFLHLLSTYTFKILAREKNVTLKMSSKSWKDIVTDPKGLFDVKDMMKLR